MAKEALRLVGYSSPLRKSPGTIVPGGFSTQEPVWYQVLDDAPVPFVQRVLLVASRVTERGRTGHQRKIARGISCR